MKRIWLRFINWLKHFFGKKEQITTIKQQEDTVHNVKTPYRRTGFREGKMRNKLCPCGSGIKYKKCCWLKK